MVDCWGNGDVCNSSICINVESICEEEQIMDIIIKGVLFLGCVLLLMWINIYSFYKPLKGDGEFALSKKIAMVIFVLFMMIPEGFILLLILGL